MLFDWDPEESAASASERGFDFEFATQVFDGPVLEVPDSRRDYGEARIVAVGSAEGRTLTIVYADRRTAQGALVRRIISARRSNHHEREAYETAARQASE